MALAQVQTSIVQRVLQRVLKEWMFFMKEQAENWWI
jgi:hypothetical protein